MSLSEKALPLATVIEDLRRELIAAVQFSQDQPIRFRLHPVEIELEVGIERAAEAEGGAKFWVLNFGGKASSSNSVTHKIKLTLEPVAAAGSSGELLVSGVGIRD